MPLDLDPIYRTKTMVKILREQGSTLSAMELAEQILAENPDNEPVREILAELKAESKASFERFRQAGRSASEESPPPPAPDPELAQVVPLRNEATALSNAKVRYLQQLLTRVQTYRKQHD